jgi:hypothetical protein
MLTTQLWYSNCHNYHHQCIYFYQVTQLTSCFLLVYGLAYVRPRRWRSNVSPEKLWTCTTLHVHNYSHENHKCKGIVNSFYIRTFFLTIFSSSCIHIPWIMIFLQKINITIKKINKRNTGRDKSRDKRSIKIYFYSAWLTTRNYKFSLRR